MIKSAMSPVRSCESGGASYRPIGSNRVAYEESAHLYSSHRMGDRGHILNGLAVTSLEARRYSHLLFPAVAWIGHQMTVPTSLEIIDKHQIISCCSGLHARGYEIMDGQTSWLVCRCWCGHGRVLQGTLMFKQALVPVLAGISFHAHWARTTLAY